MSIVTEQLSLLYEQVREKDAVTALRAHVPCMSECTEKSNRAQVRFSKRAHGATLSSRGLRLSYQPSKTRFSAFNASFRRSRSEQ
jgi:hypothetical protein